MQGPDPALGRKHAQTKSATLKWRKSRDDLDASAEFGIVSSTRKNGCFPVTRPLLKSTRQTGLEFFGPSGNRDLPCHDNYEKQPEFYCQFFIKEVTVMVLVGPRLLLTSANDQRFPEAPPPEPRQKGPFLMGRGGHSAHPAFGNWSHRWNHSCRFQLRRNYPMR